VEGWVNLSTAVRVCWVNLSTAVRVCSHGYLSESVWMICIWSSWCLCHPIVSCFIKIHSGLTFLVLAYPGFLEKRPLNMCLSVCPKLSQMVGEYSHQMVWCIIKPKKAIIPLSRPYKRQTWNIGDFPVDMPPGTYLGTCPSHPFGVYACFQKHLACNKLTRIKWKIGAKIFVCVCSVWVSELSTVWTWGVSVCYWY